LRANLQDGGDEALPADVRLLDRARAASYLGIGLDTLDRLSRQGRLPRLVLPGTRCVRFDRRALDRFVDAC
jgi:excisionase family DNA binding protein